MWKISYTIKDEKGATAIMSINLPDVDLITITDLADSPLAFASEFAAVIDPLINGQIVAINANVHVALPAGIKAAPELSSDVEEGATFTWVTADKFTSQMRVPTFRETLINGQIVDLTNAAVIEFLEMVTIPEELPADWSIAPTDARGNDIVGLVRAKENFKRSRR